MSRVLEAISAHARHHGGEPAVTGPRTTLSYRELAVAIEQAAAALDNARINTGPVAIALDNGMAWPVLDLACMAARRVVVPLPPFFNAAQIQHALADAGAVALISGKPVESRGGGTAGPQSTIEIAGRQLYLHRLKGATRALPADTAKITYSSGTTGRPKGVCLSRTSMEQVALSLVEAIGSEYAGRHLAVLPLGVLLENVAGLYTTLLAGGHYHAAPLAEIGFARPFAPDFPQLAAALAETGATSTILVPELLRGLLAVLAGGGPSLEALKLVAVGGARLSSRLLVQARELELPVFQGYGLSEAASVVAVNCTDDNVLGSVGAPLAHINISIAENGEIIFEKAPFLGYVGGPAPKAPFATGDLGYFDDTGHLYVTGRKDHLIVNAFGRNMAPEWVESELLTRPEFAQAVVFGEAQPSLTALIVPADPGIDDDRLAAAVGAVNATLPQYAQIGVWWRVAPFTVANRQLTGTGRPRRRAIEETHGRMLKSDHSPAPDRATGLYQRLVRETEDRRNALFAVPQIFDGLGGRITRDTYIAYLTEAYHHVKHTVPLLTLARDLLPPEKAWAVEALDHYIDEEQGHEQWILNDIHLAGGDREAARQSRPRMATEMMVSYAYDSITRINPLALLGMVFVLEGTSRAIAVEGAKAVMKALDLPETCFSYLMSHGTLDIKHMAFFEELVGRVADPKDQADIIHMADRMFVLYGALFSAIPHDQEAQDAA